MSKIFALSFPIWFKVISFFFKYVKILIMIKNKLSEILGRKRMFQTELSRLSGISYYFSFPLNCPHAASISAPLSSLTVTFLPDCSSIYLNFITDALSGFLNFACDTLL